MDNSSITLDQGTWVLISENVDYLAQNRSNDNIIVKAVGTETAPTTTDGAFEINPGELMGSTLLSGYVYAMCPTKTVSLVVAV